MGEFTISTENADYKLVLMAHSVKKETRRVGSDCFRKENIGNLDAIVIESGTNDDPEKAIGNPTYDYLIKNLVSTNTRIPIYVTDIRNKEEYNKQYANDMELFDRWSDRFFGLAIFGFFPASLINLFKNNITSSDRVTPSNKVKMSRRAFIGVGFVGLTGLGITKLPSYCSEKCTENKEVNDIFRKIVSWRSRKFPYFSTLRDAVTAEKVENFIAPLLRDRLDRKPTIAIVFGANHASLGEFIKNKEERKEFLGEYCASENLNNLHMEDLNRIYEIIPIEDFKEYYLNQYNHNVLGNSIQQITLPQQSL